MDIEMTPDHITADYVGVPGERTFYVQAGEDEQTVSVLVEKQQVAGLATLLTQVLAEVDAEPVRYWDVASMRLRTPVEEHWRAGAVAVGVDPQIGRFLIELTEAVAEEELREGERVRLWITEEQARTLAAHAAWSVEQGRPVCRFCGLPMDADGHVCPRTNGDARHL